MKRTLVICSILSFFVLPINAALAQPPVDPSSHAAMPMTTAQTIMVGEETIEGITGMAHLNDVGALMAQMDKKENYHFMMMFNDAATGAVVDQGSVAVKISDPKTGKMGKAIPLMGMVDHFGADVALPAKGDYQFEVGSKLADGKTRQFHFKYVLK